MPTPTDLTLLDADFVLPWTNTSALANYRTADWVLASGTLSDTASSNVKWTSGKSTATFSYKPAYDKTSNSYYPASASFSLSGEDKTALSFKLVDANGSFSASGSYSQGAATATKDDDASFTRSVSKSIKSETDNWTAKNGYGGSASLSVSEVYKTTGGTGYSQSTESVDHGVGTFTGTAKLSATDGVNKLSMSLEISGNVSGTSTTNTSVTLGAGSLSYVDDDSSVYTNTWSKTSVSDLSLPETLGKLLKNSTDYPLEQLLMNIEEYIFESSNIVNLKTIAGTTKDGHAGAGNDTVISGDGNELIFGDAGNDTISTGAGNDELSGGLGSDKLTGGKGNDIFKINKSDFDFTSSKTVLADTITDFKYTASEKDTISLDGFGSFATFQTIAAAKKAGSTANVIYESKTGNFWYNEDGDSALVGALLFANAKGIPDTYWVAAGVM